MVSLYQQLAMSYDAENTTAESLERAEQQRDPLQLQHQLEREPSLQLPSHIDRDPLHLQQQQERDQLQQQQQRDTLQLQKQQRNPLQLSQQRDPLQIQQHRDSLQLQQQRREREQLQIHQREREQQIIWHSDNMQMQQRDHINQLQSINNLLHDLPPSSKSSYHSSHGPDASYSTSLKGSNPDADMSVSDLFGLSLPRGSLMGSQSSIGSSPGYRQHHGQNYGYGSWNSNHPQFDENRGFYPNLANMDMPSTPNSVTTPGSPSTPGSVYSNSCSYPYSGNSSNHVTPSSSHRSHYNLGSPSSPGNSPYYGRPIRGSPAYSDCSSPTYEYPHMLGFTGSRSNSPADSETSGYSSMDGSLSDIMVRNCLSLNSSGHSCHPQSLSGLMPPDLDLYHGGNRVAAYQRMAAKKYQQQQQHHSNMRHHHCCSPGNYVMPISKTPNLEPYVSLDRAARCHRNAAALCEATCTWVGELPKRTAKSSGYSSKVFLGGVPWDVTESLLVSTFKQFGPIRVEWPGKEQSESQPKGYAYIIFESEKQVKALLSCCSHRLGDDKSYYYKITPKRSKPKDVQVIPWHISDSNYSKSSSQKLDPEKTVFVGALHGMLTAEGLATVLNDLFDEVIYAGIDTDKWKYPIGSARVTFSSKRSYKKACAAAFVEIKAAGLFTKKVQIDPYIEDSVCSACAVQHGPYFCREPICSRYFCRSCWHWQHASEPMRHHLPMSRGWKANIIAPLGYHSRANAGNRLSIGSMV